MLLKWQTDIYGNEYGIFKDKFGQYNINQISQADQFVTCLTLDGHVFFDLEEGYAFDYSVYEQVDAFTLRSGVTALTVNDNTAPSFALSSSPLWFNFRQFTPYIDCTFISGVTATNEKYVTLYDCGNLMRADNTHLPDQVYGDSGLYPSGFYYYDVLVDGGVGSVSPLHRAILDTPSLSGDMLYDLAYYLNSGASSIDGGLLTDVLVIKEDSNEVILNEIDDNAKTVYSNLSGTDLYGSSIDYSRLSGKAYVRRAGDVVSTPLSASLQPIIEKYNDQVQSSVNNQLRNFDIIYDTIVLETDYVILLDKISFDGDFTKPSTKNTFYTLNTASTFNKASNRWFRETANEIVFCIMQEYPTLSGSNSKIIYPNIYKYTISDNKCKRIWPTNIDTQVKAASSMFAIPSDSSFGIVSIDTPKLTYNSANNLYKLTYIGNDLNNYPHIFDIQFKERNTFVEIMSAKLYTQTENYISTTVYAAPSSQYITFGFMNNLTPTVNGII